MKRSLAGRGVPALLALTLVPSRRRAAGVRARRGRRQVRGRRVRRPEGERRTRGRRGPDGLARAGRRRPGRARRAAARSGRAEAQPVGRRRVRRAELLYRAHATPNDPRFGELYGLNNTGQTGGTADADIDAPEGWDALGLERLPGRRRRQGRHRRHGHPAEPPGVRGGRVANCGGVNNFGTSLVIIIVGSDPTIVNGKCDDDNGHGTHVAGTIAANANNGTGVAGVAFNSPLAICKALNCGGSGTLVMIANCITWLNQRDAEVISMSLGGSSGSAALQQRRHQRDQQRFAAGRGRGQQRQLVAELPGRLRRGRLGRGDGPQRREGVVLAVQRRRRGRGAGSRTRSRRGTTAPTTRSRARRWRPRTRPRSRR